MDRITGFQLFELIAIPITILASVLFMFVIGASFIGDNFWNIMGFPTIIGTLFSLFILVILVQKGQIKKFSQIETIFRLLAIGGGGLLIPVIFLQLNGRLDGFLLISILALVFSIIGGLMALISLRFLWQIYFIQQSSE
ncbi:MAG: hypothetical protein EAX86_08175 [Candidatus Heimdallarchaeota archaeon]|nr:hypothetical protein [Candidatus Heimdallarchaeota archaeon]